MGIDQLFGFHHRSIIVTWRYCMQEGFYVAPPSPGPMLLMRMPRFTRSDALTAQVGNRLAATRDALGLSQGELAELMHISRGALANWEVGRGLADASKMLILKERFKVSLDWIYSGDMSGLPSDLLAKLLKDARIRAA